jgi:tripartite-type tricarboxylate transporter receptor subunit TctC
MIAEVIWQPEGKLMRKTFAARLVGAILLAAAPAAALAQDFPTRTIKIVVPVPPGSAADILPRIVAEKLSARWGQPVVVENRLGGALNIAAEAVAKAEPDGYTLLATPAPPLAINQSLHAKLNFDPAAFVPVTVMAATPLVLVAGRATPFATFEEFVAYAKAQPARLTYASSGAGSTPHLAMELLKAEAGIDLVHVPYKGLVPTDLLAGHVDVMFNILGNTLPHIRSGALKMLAAGSDRRIAEFPDTPAVAEHFPGVVATAWFAVVAPPRTPPALADRLSAAIAEILRQPEVVKRLQDDFAMTPVASPPAEAAAFIAQERERWRTVILSAGIRPE